MEISGILLETKRFAVHDGPGIRTAFFTKGCPLKCRWCHNPESISPLPQTGFYQDLCRHCGSCLKVCSGNAHTIREGKHLFESAVCRHCGSCEEVCPGNAMKLYGRKVTVKEAFGLALEDRDFYEESGGGVTVSGGEPLAQKEFTLALLRELKKEKIHTAIDSCAFVPQKSFEEALEVCDLFLIDVKHADSQKHEALTGRPNELIKSNLQFLSEAGAAIEIRIPFVPGCNDTLENMEQTGEFLGKLKIERVKLLPFHALAGNKYRALQMENTIPAVDSPEDEALEKAAEILKKYGLNARSGRE